SRCRAQDCPDLAFYRSGAITGSDLIWDIRKFLLLQQGLGEDGQIICFVPVAFACCTRLALRQPDIAELEINLGEASAKDRILRRLPNGVLQLDLSSLEISFSDVLFRLVDGHRRLLRTGGGGDGRENCGRESE